MRIASIVTVSLLALGTASPTVSSAQINVSVAFGTRLGPEVGVFAYSNERLGDWRRNYRNWTPVTLYDVNGHYYRNQVRGSRAVVVYTYHNEFFFPPQEVGFNGLDSRYNYRRRPTEVDYGRVRPYTPAVDIRLGTEIGVFGFSAERAGDWRKNYRRWTPVTLYEVNGRYYPNNVSGARQVSMYRYQNEYFLPPNDERWIGVDKRFDYGHRPSNDDHGRVRGRP